jgi:membrane peptidoglycan carboxypeptidase
MSPQTAYMMTSVLTDNRARAGDFKVENPLCFTCYPDNLGFGASDNGQQYIAAKTGTSQGATGPKDVVTMGYSRYMALGVWAGNSDPNDDLKPNIIGITGAGYVFHDVMAWAIKNYHWPARPFPIPDGMTRAQFNCNTGLAPYKGTDPTAFASDNPDTPGSGWCRLSGSGADLYVGYLTGRILKDTDWIEQGQLPDVS